MENFDLKIFKKGKKNIILLINLFNNDDIKFINLIFT